MIPDSNQYIIDLEAVQSNVQNLTEKLPSNTRLMAMVKARGYGTDCVLIASFLESCGVDIVGVATVNEGCFLKENHITQNIFVFTACPDQAKQVVQWDLEVAVSDDAFVKALQDAAQQANKVVKVHLHINTGMGRLGCRHEQALILAQFIQACPNLLLEGIMTHFSSAHNPNEDAFTLTQIQLFRDTLQTLKKNGITAPWVHAANSSAVLRFDLPDFNMARVGLAIYGLYASDACRPHMHLTNALTLKTRIIGINSFFAGESISYDRNYKIQGQEELIAVIPMGYSDGMHRAYGRTSEVLLHGQKAPIVGDICMDHFMVNITHIPEAKIGDSVTIFGKDEYGNETRPEEFANRACVSVYELIACIGTRIPRILLDEKKQKVQIG